MEIMSAAHTDVVGRIDCPISSQGSISHSEKEGQTPATGRYVGHCKKQRKMFSDFLRLETGIKTVAFPNKGKIFLRRSPVVQLREVMSSVQEAESKARVAVQEF